MQRKATYQTNRIDLFCKTHLDSDSDAIRRRFIRWNLGWFRQSPTFWLPVGRWFWVEPPVGPWTPLEAASGVGCSLPIRHWTAGRPGNGSV